MADVNNIKLSPEQMVQKAAELDTRCTEFERVVTQMKTMITNLCEEWAGKSSQAYYDQFSNLEPSFQATSELITSIGQQLRDVSEIMQSVDQEIASKIGVK